MGLEERDCSYKVVPHVIGAAQKVDQLVCASVFAFLLP